MYSQMIKSIFILENMKIKIFMWKYTGDLPQITIQTKPTGFHYSAFSSQPPLPLWMAYAIWIHRDEMRLAAINRGCLWNKRKRTQIAGAIILQIEACCNYKYFSGSLPCLSRPDHPAMACHLVVSDSLILRCNCSIWHILLLLILHLFQCTISATSIVK